VRYPAGLKGRLHEHSAAHTIVVLQGKLDANGQVIGPQAYAHFPARQPMRHQAAGDDPCLFVIVFHGPFDVRVINNAEPLAVKRCPDRRNRRPTDAPPGSDLGAPEHAPHASPSAVTECPKTS
jgi:hypothetical protein